MARGRFNRRHVKGVLRKKFAVKKPRMGRKMSIGRWRSGPTAIGRPRKPRKPGIRTSGTSRRY